jgi:translation initiation factor IF-3
MILTRLADELAELAVVEQRPIQDGRNMTMMLAPAKAAGSDAKPAEAEAGAEASGSDGGEKAAKPEDAKAEAADDAKPEDAKAEAADDAKPAKAAAAGAKPKG